MNIFLIITLETNSLQQYFRLFSKFCTTDRRFKNFVAKSNEIAIQIRQERDA